MLTATANADLVTAVVVVDVTVTGSYHLASGVLAAVVAVLAR